MTLVLSIGGGSALAKQPPLVNSPWQPPVPVEVEPEFAPMPGNGPSEFVQTLPTRENLQQHEFLEAIPDFEGTGPVSSSGEWFSRGSWYGNFNFSYVGLVGPRHGLNLAFDSDSTTGFDPNRLRVDPGQGVAPGMVLTLGTITECRDSKIRDEGLEFTFNGLYQWDQAKSLRNANPLFPTTGLQNAPSAGPINTNAGFVSVSQLIIPNQSMPGFSNMTEQKFSLHTDYNSYEFTYRIANRLGRDRLVLAQDGEWVRTAAPRLLPSFLMGPKVVSINERFNWTSSRAATDVLLGFTLNQNQAVANTRHFDDAAGAYFVATHNYLVGYQVGTQIDYQQPDYRLGLRVRGGPYANFASQSQNYSGNDGAVTLTPHSETRSKHIAAFLGDVSMSGAYQLRPNLAVRAQYDLIFINNIAHATSQVKFNSGSEARLATGDNMFLQGATIGLDMNW